MLLGHAGQGALCIHRGMPMLLLGQDGQRTQWAPWLQVSLLVQLMQRLYG